MDEVAWDEQSNIGAAQSTHHHSFQLALWEWASWWMLVVEEQCATKEMNEWVKKINEINLMNEWFHLFGDWMNLVWFVFVDLWWVMGGWPPMAPPKEANQTTNQTHEIKHCAIWEFLLLWLGGRKPFHSLEWNGRNGLWLPPPTSKAKGMNQWSKKANKSSGMKPTTPSGSQLSERKLMERQLEAEWNGAEGSSSLRPAEWPKRNKDKWIHWIYLDLWSEQPASGHH